MFDVLIVGAGPAGAIAAIVLARAGARVLLVDRARFPRHKLCGDTLNPGALRLLRALKLLEPVARAGMPLRGMRVTGEGGVSVDGRYPDGVVALAVTRYQLDTLLVDAAVDAGVRFEPGVRVREALARENGHGPEVCGVVLYGRDGRPLRVPARVTIAADGRHSRLAFGLGLACHPAWPRRWAIGSYFEGVRDLTTLGEMHVRRNHYIGVAPLPDGRTNVCLVTSNRQGMNHPMGRILEVIGRDPILSDRTAGARAVVPATVMGPLAVDARSAGMPGLLLAGDAAGFVDPMTGDGLSFALRGAVLAAEAALTMLDGGSRDGHVMLARCRRRAFARKWRLNQVLRRLVGSSVGVTCGSAGAALAPWALEQLIVAAGDA